MNQIPVTSTAIAEDRPVPRKYTCDADNVSPPLQWEPVDGAKSYAIICNDPDAPSGDFVHWMLWNWPADQTAVPEGLPAAAELDNGSAQGTTDGRKKGYGGPCPPSGSHRYFFKVFALDEMIGLPGGSGKEELRKAMEGHILAEGSLASRYAR